MSNIVMPKVLCTALAAALASGAVPVAAFAVSDGADQEKKAEGLSQGQELSEEQPQEEVFVELADGVNENKAARQLAKLDGVESTEVHEGYVTATLMEGVDADDVADEAQGAVSGAVSAGEDVVLDWTGSVADVSDTHIDKEYHLMEWDPFGTADESGVGAARAWETLSGAKLESVSVAVVDSGVDVTHPDLAGRLDLEHAYNASNGTKDIMDGNGHGTAVAGIIAAETDNGVGVAGVAGKAPVSIIPVKCIDDNGSLKLSSTLGSLRYLCELVESGEVPELRVINCSLGAYASESSAMKPGGTLYTYVAKLRDMGVVTIASGGNGKRQPDGSFLGSTEALYPSDYDVAFGVTALQKNGCDAQWSDYNKYKDISAPGEEICTTYMGDRYSVMDGTSAAAPIVSGTFALMMAANPSLTPSTAEKIVRNTAGYVRPCEWKRTPSETGSAGALNAAIAVASAYDSRTEAAVEDVTKTYTAARKGAYKSKLAKTKSFTLRVAKGMDVKSWTAAKAYTSYNGKKKSTSLITVTKAGKVTAKRGLKKGTWKVTVKTTARTSDGRSVDSFAYVTIKVK